MAQDIYNTFSANLSRLLQERGYTTQDLAEAMDITPLAARYWLSGRNAPRISRIPELCDWLKCGVEDLLVDREDETMRIRVEIDEAALIMAYRDADEMHRACTRELLHMPAETRRGMNGEA